MYCQVGQPSDQLMRCHNWSNDGTTKCSFVGQVSCFFSEFCSFFFFGGGGGRVSERFHCFFRSCLSQSCASWRCFFGWSAKPRGFGNMPVYRRPNSLTTRPKVKYTWWCCCQTGIRYTCQGFLLPWKQNKKRPKHGYARCVGRRNGRRRGWEPATLEQLGSQENGNLYAGRAQHITSYHHISSTKPSLETCCMGRGEQNFQKFWLKWSCFNCLGFALAQSEPNFEKTSVAKDKYPSVFYMVDGRLETILDVANKISKKVSPFHILGGSSLHIPMMIIAI